MEMALDYVQRVSKVEAESYQTCASSYLNQTCKQLSIYASDMSTLLKKISGNLNEMNSNADELIQK